MSGATRGYILQPGTAEKRWVGDTFSYFLATGETTAGKFCLVDEDAPRGMSVSLHRHPDDMESFYVLEGELTVFIDDERATMRAGSFAHVPGGAVHGFRVESERARYLILTTPRHGELYKAISQAAEPDGGPPQDPGDFPKGIGKEYGIEVIGPLPK